ncbi:MAG: hypothetical protein ACXVLQ_14405 [Bacteriovorax sp.]
MLFTPELYEVFGVRTRPKKGAFLRILAKMDKEQVTTEDMSILTLKAQTNHFHHMDVEFRDEFKKIDHRFDHMELKFDKKF